MGSLDNIRNATVQMLKFKSKPGQVDYSKVRWAPVINCVLRYRGKILLVQRSKKLNFYPGYWNGVSGFLDDKRRLKEKVRDELREELGMLAKNIRKIELGEIFHQDSTKYQKTWIVHPVLVDVSTDKIILDWEAQDYTWVSLKEIKLLKLLPGFFDVLKRLFPQMRKEI